MRRVILYTDALTVQSHCTVTVIQVTATSGTPVTENHGNSQRFVYYFSLCVTATLSQEVHNSLCTQAAHATVDVIANVLLFIEASQDMQTVLIRYNKVIETK